MEHKRIALVLALTFPTQYFCVFKIQLLPSRTFFLILFLLIRVKIWIEYHLLMLRICYKFDMV